MMKTACFASSGGSAAGKPQASKEDLVLDKAGVNERKLALKLDRLDRDSKVQMKMRERDEKAMRQACRDIRKHRMFDDLAVGRKTAAGSGAGNRLLPPISTPDSSQRNIRRVRSTPNSPVGARKVCSSASSTRSSSPSSTLTISDSDQEGQGLLRVKSAGPGLRPAVLHHRLGSTSNLPGASGSSSPIHGTPAITVYAHGEGKKQQRSNPDLSDISPTPPASPSPSTAPNTPKQRAWERGLTPARRPRTPAELAKAQGSLSYLAPSAKGRDGLRASKSENNISTLGLGRCAEDPRFQKLTSCLVRNDETSSPRDDNQDDLDADHSSSAEALTNEMVAIRITSSTPTLPSSRGDTKTLVPHLPGHLKEPGGSLPPLKAHNPRTASPRILVDNTVSHADAQEGVVTEETVELGHVSLGSVGASQKELIILDTSRLKPGKGEDIKSPPFYGKVHNPDW